VTSVDETAREIGHEHLRAASLRLPDRSNEWRDDRYLHAASALNAMSRGGLRSSAS